MGLWNRLHVPSESSPLGGEGPLHISAVPLDGLCAHAGAVSLQTGGRVTRCVFSEASAPYSLLER